MVKYKDEEISTGNFFVIQPGENIVRIVSEFEKFQDHWLEDKNKSVICVGKDNKCEQCAQKMKIRIQYFVWVIDRRDNKVKIMRYGWSIHKQLAELARGDKGEEYAFEDNPGYDISIEKQGEHIDTRYVVNPLEANELTAKEIEQVEAVTTDLSQIIQGMKDKRNQPQTAEGIEYPEENNNPEDIPF